ncbi:MAG: Ribonuclease Y, partial [Thermotoga sp. 47_83]
MMLWYIVAGAGGLLIGYLIANYQINQKLRKAKEDAQT